MVYNQVPVSFPGGLALDTSKKTNTIEFIKMAENMVGLKFFGKI